MTAPLLLRGDARNLPLADESVDLICTSPPYFGLRDYGVSGQVGAELTPREFVDALVACTAEMVRVLKPSGSIFVNLGDKYSGAQAQNFGGVAHAGLASKVWAQTNPKNTGIPNKSLMLLPERYRIRAVDELGLIARAVLVWSKPNGLPESVKDRVRRSHEDWVHLTRRPQYFSSVDEIREPTQGRKGQMSWEQRKARGDAMREGEQRGVFGAGMADNPLGRLPGSTWEIPTQPLSVPASLGVDHFAAMPMEWPRRLILGWSPPAGVVLDPFSGTGTTALVATMLGRRGVGVELSADYQRIAAWRCSDPKERARAAGLDSERVAAIKPQVPGQESLLDLFGGEVA